MRITGSFIAAWLMMTAAALVIYPCPARAGFLEPAAVSQNIPEPGRSGLIAERSALLARGGALESEIKKQNAQCGHVDLDNAAQVAFCGKWLGGLKAEYSGYLDAVRAFNKKEEFLMALNSKEKRWEPLNAPDTNDQSHRSAYNYFKVIRQFKVQESERYASGKATYCNIYVWDVTRAMGAEIPHWVIKGDPNGASAVGPDGKFIVAREECVSGNRCREERANDLVDWLRAHGKNNGWSRVDARMAQEMADGGHPAIAIWRNAVSGAPGHVAMVRPGSVGDRRGDAISQAGGYVVDAKHIRNYFNKKGIQYWYHD